MTDLPHEAYLASIAGIDGVGPKRMRWLLSHGTPEEVWSLLTDRSLKPGPDSGRVDGSLLARWAAEASKIDPEVIWRRCTELGVGVVSLGSAGYPPVLADDIEPPIVMFQKGDPDALNQGPRVAIVGTRRATGYGLRVAETLGSQLAEAGVVVVSGLALGVDAAAHRGALGAPYGDVGPVPSVVAVVANGLDAPCPTRNRQLAAMVAQRGVIYSEVPPGMPSAPWRFPVRNRVIAALADAVVVVESAGAGGSMHTVREALDRDRPVLAVPGPVDSRASEGVNQLIRDGAAPCLGVEDVLMALQSDGTAVQAAHLREVRAEPTATGDPTDVGPAGSVTTRSRVAPDPRPVPAGADALVLDSLDWRPVSLDRLAASSGLGLRQLASSLSNLESAGWIVRSGSWIERKAR